MAISLLAGCGKVSPPPPGDLAGLVRPGSPNTALAGPAGFQPPPDRITPHYELAPQRLFAAARRVVLGRPRTTELATDPARLRLDAVERSRVFRFADVIQLQVRPAGTGSELIVYSRSLSGHYDFGVNTTRVAAILAALQARLRPGPDGSIPLD